MFSKYSLYINAVRSNNSLKLDYKKLENNQILESSQSTFISNEEILPRDVVHKINASQQEVNDTYIASFLLSDNTKIIKKEDAKRLKDYARATLNSDMDVVIAKNKLFESKHFFEATGVDYIYSAYHVLNQHLENNSCINSLVTLFFNDQAFIVILNEKGEIVFNKVVTLTSFDNVKNSKFYDSDVIGQKLYDEVHSLEVLETINSVINEFYETTNNTFIEEVVFLYTVKQLSQEQIDQMAEELMLKFSYHPISMEEELFALVKNSHQVRSFTKPRSKPKKSYTKFIFSFLAIIIFALLVYLIAPMEMFNKESKTKPQPKVEVKKEFKLPNHVEKNLYVQKRVKELLSLVPYDVLLKDIEVTKDGSKLVANFLKDDIYITTLEPALLKLYKSSKIEYTNPKEKVLEGVITNSGVVPLQSSMKIYEETYITDEFIPILRVTEQLKTLFPKQTIISFKSSYNSDIVTFNYKVNIVLQNPSQFDAIVELLNNELYSINISYPISMIKTDLGLETDFILQFHQPK